MGIFPRYWPFVWGIHRSTVNSPHKDLWRRYLIFSLICAWINGWVNNRETGELRCYRAHYGVTVMLGLNKKNYCINKQKNLPFHRTHRNALSLCPNRKYSSPVASSVFMPNYGNFMMRKLFRVTGGCFTNISRARQIISRKYTMP